ncbi:MAG: heme-binding protein [Dehalococcoidia bacterium]
MNFFSHKEVMDALAAGLAEAEKRGVAVGISVVDEGGNLVGSIVMGGAKDAWLADDSRGKAMVPAVFEGRPSGELQERSNSPMNVWLNTHYGGRLNYLKGGVPIYRNGQLVGGAGAGGAPLDDDEAIAWVVSEMLGDKRA